MKKRKRPSDNAISTMLKELRGEDRAKKIEITLLLITLISTSTFIIIFTTHHLSTGYSLYLENQAGYITELTIEKTFPTSYWSGIYGLALRVPGFTEQLYTTVNNDISRQDLFFNCLDSEAVGGPEIYASASQTIDFDSLQAATLSEIDNYTGCNGLSIDCAITTYTKNMSVLVGATNISEVPSTHTYKWTGENEIFDIGALVDGLGNMVFVAHIDDLQKGYSPNVTVNYQMLLPNPEDTSLTYYFFSDPNDDCPAGGGIGELIQANIYGYIKDESSNPIENASVIIVGNELQTDSDGLYNTTFEVAAGNYSIIARKDGYDDTFSNISISASNYTIEKNMTLYLRTPGYNETEIVNVYGYVKDSSENPLYNAQVHLGGITTMTNVFGYYSLYASVTKTTHPVTATLLGYNNNFTLVDLSSYSAPVQADITLSAVSVALQDLSFDTGPYTEEPIAVEELVESGEDYWVSTKEVVKEVRRNTFSEETIGIYNFNSLEMSLTFSLSPELEKVVKMDNNLLTISGGSIGEKKLTFYGLEPIGTYKGNLSITGSIEQEIPITVKIVERRMPIETLLINLDLFRKATKKGSNLKYRLVLQNLLSDQGYPILFKAKVTKDNSTEVISRSEFSSEIKNSLTTLEEIEIPEDAQTGNYILSVEAKYLNLISKVTVPFQVTQPVYLYAFLGIPLWVYLALISFISFILLNLFIYKRHLDKKKRYSVAVDYSALPQKGERTIRLGHIAETKKNAFLEVDKLTTHAVVAGATGMGKSIAAQVLIEEALMQNINVIVFDPTAQWSGMLRKCEDKKMFSFYPKFGMKPEDARGFPGNIRAVKDARQIIDINKYFKPGHIQIFTLNKLQPKDMDIFVANVIRQIFKSDPKESPNLKTLIVFDEVHRLLPKFGGSGEGFLQIERGCREFRKWGLGQVLISQVMNDFVGEIKANINTEVQTRTVEEGDLERIKTKYGEGFLKSLVKSEVGVAMFQNAEYNKGLPYFINFRPILHNTRRLSDEELEKYNQYNDQVEDLEYQIEQLEAEKVDIFDLNMELKLVKDKIMTGNFAVVDIYLEGLKPRIAKQWEKLGKKPKKKELELADISDIKKSIAKAKAEREKAKAEDKKATPAPAATEKITEEKSKEETKK